MEFMFEPKSGFLEPRPGVQKNKSSYSEIVTCDHLEQTYVCWE